jgi:hypothetical protein
VLTLDIGQQFALTEMGYTLVRIFQKFDKVVDHMYEVDGGKAELKCGKWMPLLRNAIIAD